MIKTFVSLDKKNKALIRIDEINERKMEQSKKHKISIKTMEETNILPKINSRY